MSEHETWCRGWQSGETTCDCGEAAIDKFDAIARELWCQEFGEHSPYTGWVERVAKKLRETHNAAIDACITSESTHHCGAVAPPMWPRECGCYRPLSSLKVTP